MRKFLLSILGILCSILYVFHTVYTACLLIGLAPVSQPLMAAGGFLFLLLLVHMLLSLPFALGRMFRSGRVFLRLNLRAVLQYAAGVLLIVFACVHVPYFYHRPGPVTLILMLLMLAACAAHLFLSFPHSLITLGLLHEESGQKKAAVLSAVLIFLPTAFAMIAMILYYPHFYTGG